MDKKEYISEKEWLKDNIKFKPLSASGYLGKPRRYSMGNYIPLYEKLFRDYISDNADNSELLKYIGINDNYSLDEFLNFKYNYNNFGFRDDVDYEIDNSENEIWCFGCSWTMGLGIPMERAWPKLIEKETGFVVKNFGIGGAGAPTMLRLIENWLKFSKHKPRYILILGYFEHRLEIETVTGDYRRLAFYRHVDGSFDGLGKSDKLKIKQEKNKFRKDPDNYGKPYIDKINDTIKEFDSITLSVHDYETTNYALARDLQFFNYSIDQYEKRYNDHKIRKGYYELADELFSNFAKDYDKRFVGFGKWWTSHLGTDLQQDIAKDFLRNLTI